MLPSPHGSSSYPGFIGSLWAWATKTTPAASVPSAGDEPPLVVASGGIDPGLSESLSHVITVRPLGDRPAGIGPAALLDDPPAPAPDHVIDIRLPLPGRGPGGEDRKHAEPQDFVIDIRDRADDEEAPREVQAPARMARDGSRRLIAGVRFDVPVDATAAVHRAARQLGAAGPEHEAVTKGETRRIAARMGMELAACGFLTQFAGRTVGLLVTSALRRSDPITALEGSLGVILASNLLFGGRTALLITRALGLEEPAPAGGAGGGATQEEARLAKAARVAAALFTLPLLTQALLPLLGTYVAGTTVGAKIAATIVGRLTSALVRDGLTQAVSGTMRSVEVVTANGKLPDPKRLRNEYDPLRIRLAVALYTMTSGLFLIGTADAIGNAIEPGSNTRFMELVRWGLGPVLASSVNEGLDGLMPSLARAEAAIEHGLRLVPKGWHAEQRRLEAERNGRRPPPATQAAAGTESKWSRWARLTQAHAGMRMTFGTVTADPWNASADMVAATHPSAAMMFRVVGALLNGQTGRRGYTVELGNQPTQREIDLKSLETQERTRQSIEATLFMNTRDDARFPQVREALRQEFRQGLLASGAIPADAPDREDQLAQLDLAIEECAGAWLDSQADEALKQHRRNQIRSEAQGPYHFVVNSAVNEGEMVEAESLTTSSQQSEAPTQGPSTLVSQQGSPRNSNRRLGPADEVEDGTGTGLRFDRARRR